MQTVCASGIVPYTEIMSYVGRRARMHALAGAVAVLCALAGLALPGAASAARPLVRGFADDVWSGATGAQWASRASDAGARRVLVVVYWRGDEPTAPAPGKDPSDPAGPQYNFASLDAVVRGLTAAGLQPAFAVTRRPAGLRRRAVPRRSSKPERGSPARLHSGQFAAAFARRYSGSI